MAQSTSQTRIVARALSGLTITLMAWLALPALTAASSQEAMAGDERFPESLFQGMKWRNIGPHRGGRTVAVAGIRNQPRTYYFGAVGGGVWKTQDAGETRKNISDGYFRTSSVGAIAVAPSDPNVIYVGMGEHAVRGVMTSHGDGVTGLWMRGAPGLTSGCPRAERSRESEFIPATRPGLCRRPGCSLWTHRGARRLPFSRRRPDLAKTSLCRGDGGGGGSGHGSTESENLVCSRCEFSARLFSQRPA